MPAASAHPAAPPWLAVRQGVLRRPLQPPVPTRREWRRRPCRRTAPTTRASATRALPPGCTGRRGGLGKEGRTADRGRRELRSRFGKRDGRKPLRRRLARPARVSGEALQLGEPVPDRQHRLGVVEVDGGPEGHAGEHRRAHVREAHAELGGQDVAAAPRAAPPVAHAGLVEPATMLRALRDPRVPGPPQQVAAERRPRVVAARLAMAVAHLHGRTRSLDLDRAAEAVPWCVSAMSSPALVRGRASHSGRRAPAERVRRLTPP